jgi:hypothetical protein
MHIRRSLLLSATLLLALSAGTAATAAPAIAANNTRSVDPATLTPPPPDFFGATCARTGNHITCDLAFLDPIAPVEEPTGIICGTGIHQFEVLDTWTRSVVGKRLYSADGLLLRRHFFDSWDGTLTNSVTGSTVAYSQRGTYLHDLAVPGDNSTGLERDTMLIRVFGTRGTVVIDTGRTVFARADDQIVFQAGQHPFEAYFGQGDVAALQPLCDALS